MSNVNSDGPIGFFGGAGNAGDRYANPFYGVPHKYLPQNMDHMLWWSNYFLMRFGFYRAALNRITNYFITSITIECDDSAAKRKYEEAFEKLHWKQKLSTAGMDLLAFSNLFMSINQGFDRYLNCPKCGKVNNIAKIKDYDFSALGKYTMTCPNPKCKYRGEFQVIDKPSKDIEKISITYWAPRDILMNWDETTGTGEYFWNIPQGYKSKALKPNNKFFSKITPKVIYDTLLQDRMFKFNDKNFVHMRLQAPGATLKSDGKAVPLCIYLWDDFFMLKVLQRFNEAICYEDINPFRVISMAAQNNAQANPFVTQSSPLWNSAVQKMINDHRRDPGAYSTFPFPLEYQQLGGQGKALAPTEMIQSAIANILNALYIPQELFTMTLSQPQTIGPALRLFENSWCTLVDSYNIILDHWGDIIGKMVGLPKAKIKLTPVTLSDDMERKSIIGQLVSANAIARSELLNMYGFDYREQLRKKQEEDDISNELKEEQAAKKQLEQFANSEGGGGNDGTTPNQVQDNAGQIAQQLFPLDAAQRRAELQKIKASDSTLYGAVKQKLEELTAQSKSQGNQQAQQQAGQQQQNKTR